VKRVYDARGKVYPLGLEGATGPVPPNCRTYWSVTAPVGPAVDHNVATWTSTEVLTEAGACFGAVDAVGAGCALPVP
jgi:hypothetical protein